MEEELTIEEIENLEQWIRTQSVANMHVERPRTTTVGLLHSGDVEGYLGGGVKLSEDTRLREEALLLKKQKHREAVLARSRKLKRGQRHHNAKKATKRRQKEKRWATQPLKSLTYGFGCWAITQEEWDSKVGHLWQLYKPTDLTVKRGWGCGTKDNPYTLYNISVVHRKHGVLYSGVDEWIYKCSAPNALDIEKAPEGALLFSSLRLTLKEMRRSITMSVLLSKY